MWICTFPWSDNRDCHVNLPHIIRWTCPRLRSSCRCHLFLYEDRNTTGENAKNFRVNYFYFGPKNTFKKSYFRQIGTAVFNGGFSTFLAFILLAFSDSYVFLTFVKVRTFPNTVTLLHFCVKYGHSTNIIVLLYILHSK